MESLLSLAEAYSLNSSSDRAKETLSRNLDLRKEEYEMSSDPNKNKKDIAKALTYYFAELSTFLQT